MGKIALFLGPARVVRILRGISMIFLPVVLWWRIAISSPKAFFNPYLAVLGIALFLVILGRQVRRVMGSMDLPSWLMRRVEVAVRRPEAPRQRDQLENYLKQECKSFLVPALTGNSIYELAGAEMLRSVGKLKGATRWIAFIAGEVTLYLFPSYALVVGAWTVRSELQTVILPLSTSVAYLAQSMRIISSASSSWLGWVTLLLLLEILYMITSRLDMKRFGTVPLSTYLLLGFKAIYSLSGAILNLVRSAVRGLYSWYHGETRFTVVQQLESSVLQSLLRNTIARTGTGKNLAFVEYSPAEDGDYLRHANEFFNQYALTFSGTEPRKVSQMMARQFVNKDELVKRLQESRPTIRLGVVDGRCAFLIWTRYDFYRKVRKSLFFLDSSDVAKVLKGGLKGLEAKKARAGTKS